MLGLTLNDTPIYRMVMEETRWGAVSPGGTLAEGSHIFWPKGEPFFEG
jgi:hypothetical protein